MRVKAISIDSPYAGQLEDLPNFSASGSVPGMKKQFYGKDALLIRSGGFIYNATSKPELYHAHAH